MTLDLFVSFVQFAEIMLKIEEYISKQPKASEGTVQFRFVYKETVLITFPLLFWNLLRSHPVPALRQVISLQSKAWTCVRTHLVVSCIA